MKIALIIFVFLDIAEEHGSNYVWHLVAIIRKEVSDKMLQKVCTWNVLSWKLNKVAKIPTHRIWQNMGSAKRIKLQAP